MIVGNKVKLREKRLSDARRDYLWQTDPELAHLDANPLTTIPFSHYLLDYSSQIRYPVSTRRVFAVESLDGCHIGNCTYYHIDETRGEAELGVMVGDREYWDKGYGADAVMTLVKYIFLQTGFKRIHLKTLDWNRRAQRCFEKCGFTPCGHLYRDGYSFVVMELHRKQWEEQQEKQYLQLEEERS